MYTGQIYSVLDNSDYGIPSITSIYVESCGHQHPTELAALRCVKKIHRLVVAYNLQTYHPEFVFSSSGRRIPEHIPEGDKALLDTWDKQLIEHIACARLLVVE